MRRREPEYPEGNLLERRTSNVNSRIQSRDNRLNSDHSFHSDNRYSRIMSSGSKVTLCIHVTIKPLQFFHGGPCANSRTLNNASVALTWAS